MHRSTPTTTPIDVDGSQQLHRDGAEGARRAHNPEVVGSNPTSGIYHSLALSEAATLSPQHTHPFSSAAEHPCS